ncbi:MAG: hypothetical protein KDJ47_05145 [Hyphomicrobiaceae bacterium]|nr:hypothetical protein [Hyphomicrobiaceae bacterium]
MHEELIEALRGRLPDEFSTALLDGAIRVLADPANRIRLNQFAGSMRELYTYILHGLAPDDNVRRCPWFAEQRDARARQDRNLTEAELNRPTRRQRAMYALQGGITDAQIVAYGFEPDDARSEFLDAIDELNRLTHVRPEAIFDDLDEVARRATEILEALKNFYRALDHCRESISETIIDAVRETAFGELTREAIGELDILSQHTFVEGPTIDQIRVLGIDADKIYYVITGEVEVTLNYGSGEDGVSMNDAFPFELTMEAPVAESDKFENIVCQVDTGSFYE